MIINSDYSNIEEQNVRIVAIETCSCLKDNRKADECRITIVARRSPVVRVLPVIMPVAESVIQRNFLSQSPLKGASYIFRFIDSRIKELAPDKIAQVRRGVGA